jgi:hypothetical protein
VTPGPLRYRSADEDSSRWSGFAFRAGDIVISTRSKSGTTWVQMICALLILRTPDLTAPLAQLSPWMDWLVEPRELVHARLAAQSHRRFIKTHTPLDGVPLDPRPPTSWSRGTPWTWPCRSIPECQPGQGAAA